MKAPQSRELPWSLERTAGWRGQHERMKRWHARLLAMRGSDDLDGMFDVVLAFFTNCYHLRDWLHQDGTVSQAALDDLFRHAFPLRVCADIANIAKHYALTNPPRMARQLSIAREYADAPAAWFGHDGVLRVLSDGSKYDIMELVAACETSWERFLRTRSLL